MGRIAQEENRQVVMARCFRDEPVKLFVARQKESVFFVYREKEERAIGFPSDLISPFNTYSYGSLRRAWEAGDDDRLQELWNSLGGI